MARTYYYILLVTLSIVGDIRALSLSQSNRRVFIANQGVILSGISTAFLGHESKPAYADVSDGNSLPEGAAQYGRILRLKSDLIVCFFNI